MTCQHMSYSSINKSKGGSVIASASYDERREIFDELEGRTKMKHTQKDDFLFSEMLLPEGAPEEYRKTEKLWNELNGIEKDKTAYRFIFPFQRELALEQNMEVIRNVMNEEFVRKGLPVQLFVHKGEGDNMHVHALAADRQLIKGKWAAKKSETKYYRRGTVKVLDEKGKVVNPDAVVLSFNDKVNTPKLDRQGNLMRDHNGNIIFTRGWQELQYDSAGNPLMDAKGKPILIDIREPDYDSNGIQKMSKNGKYKKLQWKRTTDKFTDVSVVGHKKIVRQTWQRHLNAALKKYGVKDENGILLQVDFRSYKEQNKERPTDEQLIPTIKIGYGKNAKSKKDYNAIVRQHNANIKKLHELKMKLTQEKQKLTEALKAKSQNVQKFIPQPIINQTTKSALIAKTPTARTNVATVAAKTLSVLDDIAGKEVPASSGKILRKERPLTKEDWILREFLDDGTDAIDELPNHKPKTNAMRELQNALSTFQEYSLARSTEPAAQSAEPVTDNITISSTDDAQIHEAKMQAQAHAIAVRRIDDELEKEKKQKEDLAAAEKEYMAIKEPRIAAGNELRSQFIDFRLAVYSADRQKLDDLKTELDNEKQRLLNNRSSWQKLRNQKPKLSEEDSKNLRHLQNQYSLTKIRFDKKYPELQKYPDIPEPQNKMRHHFAKIQISVVKDYAKKMGWTDPNQTIAKYEEIHAREQYLYCIVNPPKGQDDPASGQTVTPVAKHESAPPAPEKNAEIIKNARLEASRKHREKEEKRKQNKGRPRT